MKFLRRDILKASGYAVAGSIVSRFGGKPAFAGSSLKCDVCVIGGGSAGTYAAVGLQGLGKTVVVLEKTGRLGGQADTYYDNGVPVEAGVRYFENTPTVQRYFSLLNVSSVQSSPAPGPTAYVDFLTGQLSGYTPPAAGGIAAALAQYQQLLTDQFPYLDSGFQLPGTVPEDLVNPFGAFVTKYGLQDLVFQVFEDAQGLGNLLDAPALYVLKKFSLTLLNSMADLLSIPAGTQHLYNKAAALLGTSVLLNTTVVSVTRPSGSPIQVVAKTPAGRVVVQCDKLVVAFPPTLSNFAPFDLDPREVGAFSALNGRCYVTALVRLSGLEAGLTITNTGIGTEYNLPPLPALYSINPTAVPGLWNVLYGAEAPVSETTVERTIQDTIQRMANAGTYPVQFLGYDLYRNHTPFEMMVPANQIASGYYERLNSLQGLRNTFYTGAAFQTNDSCLIWQFTEGLLPIIAP